MGDGGVVFKPTRHEHGLQLTEGLPAYQCSGCKGHGVNTGYKCGLCHEFVLHSACVDLPDEYDHPFLAAQNPFEFRCNTRLRHHCKACGLVIRGFLFQSSKGWKFHPLCLMLPLTFTHSGHPHPDLQLVTQEEKYRCTQCEKENKNWKYKCMIVTCDVKMDMNCAMANIHALSQHGITQVYKPSKTQRALQRVARASTAVGSMMVSALITAVVGEASNAVTNRGRVEDGGEGSDDGGQSGKEGGRTKPNGPSMTSAAEPT